MIKHFLDHLRIDKGSSPHTLAAYERDLKQFDAHLNQKEPVTAVTADIERFLKHLRTQEQKSTSIARKVSALKQFYKFLTKENLIKENPTLFIEAPVQSSKLPKALDADAIGKILEAVDRGKHTESPLLATRDRAMIYLLYATGMRVSELLTVRVSQLDTEGGFVKVMGKRSKERVIPFAPIAGEHVLDYLTHVRPTFKPKSEVLFLGHTGAPLTRQAFWKTLKKIATDAGLDQNLHPHLLRHTFATDLLKSGMNLRSLQMLLGHADLQTTQIYTHVAPEKLKDVINQYHPRGSGKKNQKPQAR
ncbi:MAG: tyrosine recombinase [Bdellovibrionales bacterium]|nr:tyrosine recombinase [Bdellovibrionales bacterium]